MELNQSDTFRFEKRIIYMINQKIERFDTCIWGAKMSLNRGNYGYFA